MNSSDHFNAKRDFDEIKQASPDAYFTLDKNREAEIVVSRSRFLAFAQKILNEEDAIQFLTQLKKAHPFATHFCYAYTIGPSNHLQKKDDDGEPQGSGGRPILEVIFKKSLTNVMVVVIRYYGGTKLGIGGLVRAYSDATLAVLAKANIVACVRIKEIELILDYQFLGKLEYELVRFNLEVKEIVYLEKVTIRVCVPLTTIERFLDCLNNLSAGSIKWHIGDEYYFEKLLPSFPFDLK